MFGSNVIEVGIGLVLMYFLLSLICSTITELISRAVDMRAKTLAEGIRSLLTSDKAVDFYNHALIARLSTQEQSKAAKRVENAALAARTAVSITVDGIETRARSSRITWVQAKAKKVWPPETAEEKKKKGETLPKALPFYISPKDFSLALLDLLAPADPGANTKTFQDIKDSIKNLPDGDLKQSLSALVNEAEGDLKKLREGIELWFNGTMECVQGWYRRKAQLITLLIALVVSAFANADTLMTADMLSRDATFRNTVVAAATKIVEEKPVLSAGEAVTSTQKILDLLVVGKTVTVTQEVRDLLLVGEVVTSTQKILDLQNGLSSLGYPIGWKPANETTDPRRSPSDFRDWVFKIIGVLLTAFLVSLGAPFWFDMMNKLVNLRAAGKPQPTTAEPTPPGVDELTRQVDALRLSQAVSELKTSSVDELTRQVADLKASQPNLDELTKQVAALAKAVSESQPAKG